MPSPSATPTPITPPRVPLIDQRTGLIDRAWYMFFLSLFRSAQAAEDAQVAPNTATLVASLQAALDSVTQEFQTQPVSVVEQTQPLLDAIAQRLDTLAPLQTGELQQQINTLRQEFQTQPLPSVDNIQQQLDSLRQEVQTQRQPELGSMAPLEQDNVPWLTFNTAPSPVPTAVGSMYWDGGTTMGVQMTANVLGRVNESEFVYAKASSAITKGQLCYHTGAVGASGVITAAPTPLNLANPNEIVGVAAENIALNSFGLIQISGDLRGFNTTGGSVGETWADGDALYYNPAYVGAMTNVKPLAPNQKTYIGEVVNAASAGSGSMHIRIVPGSILGGTDSNVQITSVANKDVLVYDSTAGYWKNAPVSTAGAAVTGSSASFTSLSATSLSVETNGAVNYFKATAGNAQITFLPVYGTGNTNLVFSASGSSAQDAQISAGVGSASNLVFYTGGATLTERLRLDGSGNVSVGNAALATTATNGFLYVPTCAGTPTGTPTTMTGRAPIVVDSTNNKLYFYSGGAWRDAGP